MKELLSNAAKRAIRYLESLGERRVFPAQEARERLAELEFDFPGGPTSPEQVLATLDEIGSPATVASAGGRYFGFVTGGSLPATVAAGWLASAWDQNMYVSVMSPVGAKLEETALRWLVDALGLPPGTGGWFRHRRDHGQLHRPGRRAACPAQKAGLGRGSARAVRRA